MFPVSELNGTRVPIKTWQHVVDIESEALTQLKNVASLPIVVNHVACMPDVHYGKGATVGSVIATQGGISPAAVGVDIGCGMCAAKTNLKASHLPDSLKEIRHQIERDIPVGFNSHKDTRFMQRLAPDISKDKSKLFSEFDLLDSRVHDRLSKSNVQLGTLGGGNHFIELCLDQEDNVWLMLHSGSRNIGKEIAEVHINIAKDLEHNQKLTDRDLSYFLSKTKEMGAYRSDLFWAQRYAKLNRKIMFSLYYFAVQRFFPEMKLDGEIIDCHHNYVAEEVHFNQMVLITRKGAIFAGEGALGICPGSMGTRSYIVKGKGNPESFNSAAHGAGRRMSRGKAKKAFTTADLESQTNGVECRKDSGVLDEIPGAYKDVDQVMKNQSNLVETVAILKQVLCVKG